MQFWTGKRVLVTGGSGFLGRCIVKRLQEYGADVRVARQREYNLVSPADTYRCMLEHQPKIVIHGAAYYGGIWINQTHPAKIYYDNLMMGTNVIEACRLAGVDKFVGIGTACSYPGYLEDTLPEASFWDGETHESVRNYGSVKKMMAIQCWAYQKQYGFNGLHLILTNLYGPHDSYNPKRSHVVAALIRKFVEAKESASPAVEVWGSGRPIREFMYVEDAAEAIVLAAERYDDVQPLNIGTGIGTSIRTLAENIQRASGFPGELSWNREKPDGQLKKVLDVTRMRSVLEWTPPTSLEDGLEKTIAWYAENRESANRRF